MFDKLFGGAEFIGSTRALDAYALRHQAISNNLANINTPGYKRQVVNFEEQLAGALSSDHKGSPSALAAIARLKPSISTVSNTSERGDGNNVNVEIEQSAIAVNEIQFATLAQQVGGYFKGLELVINAK